MEYDLYKHFKEINLEIDNVVMRWILVLFAQEFSIDIAVKFWDRLFTQKDKLKFICYISVAIMKINKQNLMEMDTADIMEWAQKLQNTMNEMDINKIVQIALDIQHNYNKREINIISPK